MKEMEYFKHVVAEACDAEDAEVTGVPLGSAGIEFHLENVTRQRFICAPICRYPKCSMCICNWR